MSTFVYEGGGGVKKVQKTVHVVCAWPLKHKGLDSGFVWTFLLNVGFRGLISKIWCFLSNKIIDRAVLFPSEELFMTSFFQLLNDQFVICGLVLECQNFPRISTVLPNTFYKNNNWYQGKILTLGSAVQCCEKRNKT